MAAGVKQASSATARALLAAALQLHQQGELAQAESAYSRLLTLSEGAVHSDALHLLGVLRGQLGDVAGAIRLIEQAIAANPQFSAYHNNLGNLQKRAGDAGSAEASYRRAVALDARNGDAHLNLGKLLAENGGGLEARACYVNALRLAPRLVEAQMSMGRLEEAEGKLPAAIARYQEAARLAPDDPAPALMLGRALTAACHLDQAEASLRRAIELDPGSADACYNLGVLEQQRERFAEAAALYRQAIELAPAAADAWNNLGVVLSKQGERRAALAAYLKATELRPDCDGAFHNLGKEALKLGAEKAAEKYLRRAIVLNPANALAWHDLGAVQQAQGLLETAIDSYQRAVALPGVADSAASFELRMNLEGALALQGDPAAVERLGTLVAEQPDHAEARFNWSTALLLHGQYEAGWREYEWRRQVVWLQHNFPPGRQPTWNGSPFAGRTLLLYAEQGFGDTLQCLRYLPLVAGCGGRVILEVQPALCRLLQGLPEVESCIAQGDPVPDADLYLPLMSLPFVFGTVTDTIPPPLALPVVAAERPGFRVGLVWAGNPGHSRDRLRSLSLDRLQPLAAVPGVEFISLQTGPAAAQIEQHGAPFRFAGDCSGVRDFADTAAILAGLDLVVSIDSAVAHLAGSMGKPVWILLANVPDWRWGFVGERTPWYPLARLFRQQAPGDWAGVATAVAERLRPGDIGNRDASFGGARASPLR